MNVKSFVLLSSVFTAAFGVETTVHVSTGLASSICQQQEGFINAESIQPPVMSGPASDSEDGGWITIKMIDGIQPTAFKNDFRGIAERKWANGRIPYLFKEEFSDTQKQIITETIDAIKTKSCIDFALLEGDGAGEEFYLSITTTAPVPTFPEGCYAENIGRNSSTKEQILHLGNEGCFKYGVTLHELVHVVGLFHEQARSDRDKYVKINFENVKDTPEARANFEIKENEPIGPYDYTSLMHYPRNLFSKDPALDTITPLNDRVNATGQLDGLSPCDIYKINSIYACQNQDIDSLKSACEQYVKDAWGGEP